MANNARNRTKREKTDVSKKSKLSRKENLPKRLKVNKSPLNGSIAISKQLIRKNVTAQHNGTNKACSKNQTKRMPSLNDLEKMYEDSDEADDVKAPLQWQPTSPKLSTNLDNELFNFAIKENVCKNRPNEDILSPIKKFYDRNTCNGLHNVLSSTKPSSNISRTTEEYPRNEQNKSCLIELDTPDNTIELNKNTTAMEENIDCNSSDSSKTIDYNLSTSIIFCPLPSTSNDNNTIIKNDELFYESLKNASFTDNDGVTNEPDLEKKYIANVKDKENIDSDTDCIIIENDPDISKQTINYIDLTKQKPNTTDSTKLKDIDINNKEIVSEPIDVDDDLYTDKSVILDYENIDIDALIADNQSMVAKCQSTQTSETSNASVVDVSLGFPKQSNPVQQNQTYTTPKSTSENNELPSHNKSQEVIFVSETLPVSSRNIEGNQINTDPQYEITPSLNMHELTSARMQINNQSQKLHVESYLLHEVENFLDRYKQLTDDMPPLSILNSPSNYLSQFIHSTNSPQPELRPNLTTASDQLSTNTHDPVCSKNNQHKTKKPKKNTTSISNSITSNITSPTRNLGDCPICMDTFAGNTLASTICGHVFCMPCLERSVKSNRRCPTCRKKLKNKGSYHQLFL